MCNKNMQSGIEYATIQRKYAHLRRINMQIIFLYMHKYPREYFRTRTFVSQPRNFSPSFFILPGHLWGVSGGRRYGG